VLLRSRRHIAATGDAAHARSRTRTREIDANNLRARDRALTRRLSTSRDRVHTG
jgi:hypothetical protein